MESFAGNFDWGRCLSVNSPIQKYVFHGRVLPERSNFNLYPPITLQLENGHLIIACLYSKLTIECENSDLKVNLFTLKNIVESTVRIIVDSLGYTLACGYDVEIESAYNFLSKDITMFGVQEEIFSSERSGKHKGRKSTTNLGKQLPRNI